MLAKEVDVMKPRTEGERKRESKTERQTATDEGTEKGRETPERFRSGALVIRN